MKLLLDTHVLLWAITDDPRLSKKQRDLFTAASSDLYLSVASLWEVAIKNSLGKLSLPKPATAYLVRQLEKNRIRLLSLQPAHLTELEALPPLHRDPFDRILAAQARSERMPLLSADPVFRKYGAEIR